MARMLTRSNVFRLLLAASFLVLLTKVAIVMVRPICTIAQRYSLCEYGWVSDESRYIDYSSMFLMTDEEASHFDLQQIYQDLNVPSSLNKTNINNIKKELSRISNPSMLIASRRNMVNNMQYALVDQIIRRLPVEIFNFLQHTSYYTFGRPVRCSVVGSSGILNNSSCGEEIDGSDFVIRFNLPPLGGFKKDVGVRSDITTLNPSQIEKQFGRLIGFRARRQFIRYLKQYRRYIWISAFGSMATMEVCRKLLRATKPILSNKQLLLGNPTHWRLMADFWRTKGVNRRLSSGIYWVANAMSFCDEVHLYGFWPFAVNHNGEPIRYHYYTDTPPGSLSKIHGFSEEFQALLQLHKRGVLRLHADKCRS